MTIEEITYIFEIFALVLACLVLCALVYGIIYDIWENYKLNKLIREWEDDKECFIDHHISEDSIGVGEPHGDTEEDITKEEAIAYFKRHIDLYCVEGISRKSEEMAIKSLEFTKWVAEEIFSDDWEYNKDSFEELACRKLEKMGMVRKTETDWELVDKG